MIKHKIASLVLATLVNYSVALASETVSLSESTLNDYIQKVPPTLMKIQLNSLAKDLEVRSFDENYGYQLEARGEYLNSKEKSLSQFAPVTSKLNNYSVGLAKNFKKGVGLKLSTYSNLYTNNMLSEATTTGLSLQFTMDLYKDFLGRLSETRWDNLVLSRERAKLEDKISSATFHNSVRKVYWALVANSEARNITLGLLKKSKEQLAMASKRFKNRVADYGEVARYKSQVAARQSQLIYQNYQRENLILQLKEMIPALAGKQIALAPYMLDKTVGEVLACTSKIKSYPGVPNENTYYDEIIDLIKKQKRLQEKLTAVHHQPELTFQSEVKTMGKALGRGNSVDDFKDDSRRSFYGMVQLSIPLGKTKKSTQDVMKLVDKKSFEAEQLERLGKVRAYHTQLVRSIDLLEEVVRTQQENSRYLTESIKVSRKKYNQARITVEQLASEEDNLLASYLDEIETKLSVIHTLIDYFSIFTETPCRINISKDVL